MIDITAAYPRTHARGRVRRASGLVLTRYSENARGLAGGFVGVRRAAGFPLARCWNAELLESYPGQFNDHGKTTKATISTKTSTRGTLAVRKFAEVIEKVGRGEWIRTTDLLVPNQTALSISLITD